MNTTGREISGVGSSHVPALAGDDWSCALTGEFCDIDNAQRERLARKKVMGEAAYYQMAQAEAAVASAIELIRLFEQSIEPEEEVRLAVVSGPGGAMIFPQSIVAVGPDKILFAGVDGEGRRVVMLQHVTQLNIMLVAAKVEGEPRRATIGFQMPGSPPLEESAAEGR